MAAATRRSPGILAGLFGLALAITLAKFGNPIIFKSLEVAPANIWEVIFATWPATWSFTLIIALALLAVAGNWRQIALIPKPVLFLVMGWGFWVALSISRSVDAQLTDLAAKHIGATTIILCVAAAFIPTLTEAKIAFRFMVFALAFALWMGWDQHYGGLETTRKAFYELPNWQSFPQEYKLKIASNRIFGPFIYPNTFAGALLIWAPVLTLVLWDWTSRLPPMVRKIMVGLFAYVSVACFFWTGSKAGWLIAMAMFVTALLHQNLKRATKIAIISAVLVLGLAGFALKFRNYFQKGATSASARIVYWKAAFEVANEHPVLGAGPGTFAKTFAPIKPPEAEMARLVHNDYLEQACDSGWPAFLLFTGFIGVALFLSHRATSQSPYHLAAWLGVLGWAMQSLVEFGLYIPAISWSSFALLGWLLTQRIGIDTPKPAK